MANAFVSRSLFFQLFFHSLTLLQSSCLILSFIDKIPRLAKVYSSLYLVFFFFISVNCTELDSDRNDEATSLFPHETTLHDTAPRPHRFDSIANAGLWLTATKL